MVTSDDLTNQIKLLKTDAARYLAMAEEFVRQEPSNHYGYFARHQAYLRLDRPDLALEDMNRAVELKADSFQFEVRGYVLRRLGLYEKAIADFNRAETMDRESWEGGFGLLHRADCHARLGHEKEALADCARLPENIWTPGPFDWPQGNKAEIKAALQRRARAAAKRRPRGGA